MNVNTVNSLYVYMAFSYRDTGGVVYIGSHSHRFSAVSLETGSEIWSKMLGDRIESSACLSKCGKYIIVGKTQGNNVGDRSCYVTL